ncbi:MAG: argininosuccinate lyase [Chloroflexi bacterium]|nr:argininosuccinate lyase [Chloroflexota bacterium]
MEAFSSSFPFDVRLFTWDVAGSIAHARMLDRQGIIAREDARRLVGGLARVYAEGPPPPSTAWEDVHSFVEQRLQELVGEAAGRLHTARSRNDQVALDLRLFTRAAVCEQVDRVLQVQETLVALAEVHAESVMPGYTHLQRAQPVVLGHHLLAYCEQFQRDLERLQGVHTRADVLPLGSGALAGVPYPLDRVYVAELLGFGQLSRNSLDAVSDRDFVVEHLAALALAAVHLSRLAEEVVLWSSAEFGFLELDDAYATGSSIMPQKKNPDVAELVRGKSGRVIGSLVALLAMLKGLPLAYNRDLQEDKEPYFDAVDTVAMCLEVLNAALATADVRTERLAAAAGGSFATATDLADYLVRKGLPFRQAHGAIGALVRWCTQERRGLEQLGLDELRRFSPLFESDAVGLSPARSVADRDLPGGTAPNQVRRAVASARERLETATAWLAAQRNTLPTVERLAALPWPDE